MGNQYTFGETLGYQGSSQGNQSQSKVLVDLSGF